MDGGDRAERMFAAVLGAARAVGLKAVAEGIETQEQLDTVKRLGCDAAQGFYLWRPEAPSALSSRLLAVDARRRVMSGSPAAIALPVAERREPAAAASQGEARAWILEESRSSWPADSGSPGWAPGWAWWPCRPIPERR